MSKQNFTDDPSILEAVDNLSSMAEIDIEEFKIGQKEGDIGVVRLQSSRWLDSKDEAKTIQAVKGTFKTVHKYLEHIYAKEGKHFNDKDLMRGVQSIMALANEAAEKIDSCGGFLQKKGSITTSKEFTDLVNFYEQKIVRRFQEVLENEEEWEDSLQEEADIADIRRRGLKDLETVMRDRDYELFYISKEDGSSFYSKNLIRHIRLVSDFDQLLGTLSGSDPLLRIPVVQDKDLQGSAEEIKEKIRFELDRWIKHAGKFRDDPFVQNFYRSIMALLLASNRRNLMGTSNAKNCLAYFNDFQNYLRLTLDSVDYQRFIEEGGEEEDSEYQQMLDLIHKIAFLLLLQRVDKADGMALFTRIVEREKSQKKTTTSSLSLWNHVLEDHEKLHGELQKFPSGPLFKVLDILHDVKDESFDPYMQNDRPAHLFTFQYSGKKANVVQMASPTRQKQIDKAAMIPEFLAALRHAAKKGEKILVVNFQDRTSWKEYARCQALEECQKNAEFQKQLDVVTFTKDTDFYLQTDVYLQNASADEFTKGLLEQIESEGMCGFSFPKHFDRKELISYCKNAITIIHKLFFAKKSQLSRKNRLDFIEIFYQFLSLKCLILSNANHLVFLAKDAIDQGPVSAATFYAFTKIMSGEFDWKEEEKDLFLSTIFMPALLVRERAVDIKILSRSISMLAVLSAELEVNRDLVHKEVDKLFKPNFSLELHARRS